MDEINRMRTDDPNVPTSPLEIVTARVEELISEADALRKVAANTTQGVKENKQAIAVAKKRFQITIAALVFLSVLLTGVLLTISLGNRGISQKNEELNRTSLQTLERLDDCLVESKDPNSCFAKQQRRTNDILGSPQGPINTVTVLTAVCTRIYLDRPTEDVDDGKKRIVDCVEAALAKKQAVEEEEKTP